ncbi:MAG: polyphosphate kinase 2 family protein [Flavobacteriales bacterium]
MSNAGKEAFDHLRIKPGKRVNLKAIDPDGTKGKLDKKAAEKRVAKLQQRMEELQFQLFAEGKRSLLICLQGLDASGKDGVLRHVIASMNPQGCRVASFKQPTAEEAAHDFLWRVEKEVPRRGEVVVFNRSHYEDVLVVRVHDLVPKTIWSQRYQQINDYESRLTTSGTTIIKCFLHISPEEQLKRFEKRLEDPLRQWKISETDYTERNYWAEYRLAYEDALSKCSTGKAPWYVIPSDHKWYRDLMIAEIIVATLEGMKMKLPKPTVDIADIRRKYHEAKVAEKGKLK